MNGATIKDPIVIGNLSNAREVAGIGDVDGDGTSDIIFRNSANGKVRIWAMDGGTIKNTLDPGALGDTWTLLP
jgi:hypothetical protein